ncbi:hypothetical protein DERP_006283 [Dermatophagoides pteronyssinus]|uniref:Uncharacterized protein n=1 Tax=Dermatophagoides pteronyssinus TaxID=6956 RepID=A0ABQ8IY01_DERPT|nr:hypothetical protein DERP_006283 [Dermatophagoides pteronyssinus]
MTRKTASFIIRSLNDLIQCYTLYRKFNLATSSLRNENLYCFNQQNHFNFCGGKKSTTTIFFKSE